MIVGDIIKTNKRLVLNRFNGGDWVLRWTDSISYGNYYDGEIIEIRKLYPNIIVELLTERGKFEMALVEDNIDKKEYRKFKINKLLNNLKYE